MSAMAQELTQLSVRAMGLRDTLTALADAADYADRTAAMLDPVRAEAARRLVAAAEEAEFIQYELDAMAEAATQSEAEEA